jgi:Ca2+-binding RTX toxin-like protein
MTQLVNGLGGTAGFGENSLARNDDGSSSAIDIRSVFPSGLNFFGTTYNSLYVNNNGNVTFASGRSQYTPNVITATTSNPMIAAYDADVDTRAGTTTASTGGTSQGTDLVYYDLDASNGIFTATWDDVGYYSNHVNKTNAFQIQLVNQDSGNFDIIFRYENIDWTTGDASGGSNGLGGTISRAGYSSGNGVNYLELRESGNQSSMLGLDTNQGNAGQVGYYKFLVRSGNPDSGDDSLSGTTGNDTISGGIGYDTIRGGDGNDIVYGNQAGDLCYGNAGNDTMFGGVGNDTMFGGRDDDVMYANAQDDVVYGNFGNDYMHGGQDNDTLYGGGGNDEIHGGVGNDVLYGNIDNDTLYGGAGDDLLIGGPGADRFLFEAINNGNDTINDFSFSAGDRLQFASGTSYSFSASGADTLVTLTGTSAAVIRLVGVAATDFNANYIVFG